MGDGLGSVARQIDWREFWRDGARSNKHDVRVGARLCGSSRDKCIIGRRLRCCCRITIVGGLLKIILKGEDRLSIREKAGQLIAGKVRRGGHQTDSPSNSASSRAHVAIELSSQRYRSPI